MDCWQTFFGHLVAASLAIMLGGLRSETKFCWSGNVQKIEEIFVCIAEVSRDEIWVDSDSDINLFLLDVPRTFSGNIAKMHPRTGSLA